jgi:hypothetical protein
MDRLIDDIAADGLDASARPVPELGSDSIRNGC